MLISTQNKKLVLNLRAPGRVTTVIPTARTFDYKGQTLVAVPHDIDEVRILRNLGIQAPSPIAHHYKWSGRYKPFEAQEKTSAFLTLNPKAFVLSDLGTGKTMAALWAYDYLKSVGKANKMLIVSPLSTLERTWADEVFQHFPHLVTATLHGTADRRRKVLAGDADIYLINHDGLAVIEKELIARKDIDTVVVDEIATFRNAQTKRWKTLNRVCAGRERLWGLTGTPTPNAPLDAWAQCRLISPQRVPPYAGKFKEATMRQVSQFKWLPRENATDIVAEAMQPSIRFSRDQCVDLPPCQFVDRHADMSPEQVQAYKEMAAKFVAEHSSGKITAANAGVKMLKLVQIACISAGTDVLTDRGWVPIEHVRPTDSVWDGVEWVSQDGPVLKGRSGTVEFDGVHLTPDHLVMTPAGWVQAKEALDARSRGELDRYAVRAPDGVVSGRDLAVGVRSVGVSVRLRQPCDTDQPVPARYKARACSELRVPTRKPVSPHVTDPAVQYMGSDAVPLHDPYIEGLAPLRRSRRRSLRPVERLLELLGGYAERLLRRSDTGQDQQRRGLRARQLPVGHSQGTSQQPSTTREVYDLVNCGPRSRFVVRGAGGHLVIVHNCGVVYGENSIEHLFPCKERVDVVREVVEQSASKVIVFVPFKAVIRMVADQLSQDYTVACVSGDTSMKDRSDIFADFQQRQAPQVLIAQPAAMSHGLTLTAASTIVWYAPITSAETFTQANGRITRPGQKHSQLIVNVSSSPLERSIFNGLRNKQNVQGILLDVIQGLTL